MKKLTENTFELTREEMQAVLEYLYDLNQERYWYEKNSYPKYREWYEKFKKTLNEFESVLEWNQTSGPGSV